VGENDCSTDMMEAGCGAAYSRRGSNCPGSCRGRAKMSFPVCGSCSDLHSKRPERGILGKWNELWLQNQRDKFEEVEWRLVRLSRFSIKTGHQ
jgi:hypothetical protein